MARKVTLELVSTKTDSIIREKNQVGAKVYTGLMFFGPSVGKSFSFYRDDGAYMHTSTIKNIEYINDDNLKLTTVNSEYMLTVGAEQEPK